MTSLKRLRSRTMLGLLAAATLQCGGDNNGPHTPTAIAQVSGNGQTGLVGQTLANPLVVKVTDASGDPVEGVSVQWAAQGGGSVSSTAVETGADGLASVQRILGPDAGDVTTTASVSGLQGSPVTFTSTANAGTGPQLALTTQPSATAQSGVAFAVQPVVQLQDADGNNQSQSGLVVTASIASGTGTLGGTLTATTGSNGAATFTDLRITGAAGAFTLRFSAPGTTPAVSSNITLGGTGGGIALLTTPPVSALDGEVFDPTVQPVVQVTDGSRWGLGRPGDGSARDRQRHARRHHDGDDRCLGYRALRRSWHQRDRKPHHRVYGHRRQRHVLAGGCPGAVVESDHRRVGSAGQLGHRPASHQPAAHREGDRLGQVRERRSDGHHGHHPAALGPGQRQSPTSATLVAADTMLFCSGHTHMPDGKPDGVGRTQAGRRRHRQHQHLRPAERDWAPASRRWRTGAGIRP